MSYSGKFSRTLKFTVFIDLLLPWKWIVLNIIIRVSLNEPYTHWIVILRVWMTENEHQNFTSSCTTWKFSIVSEIYHIWSLDHQYHSKHVTKFSWMSIYACWIVSIVEAYDKVLLNGHCLMAVWSSVAWKLCDISFVKLQGNICMDSMRFK